MKRLRHLVGSLALVASAYAAQAETGKHVLRILVVDVQANPSAYVKQVERGKPILKRLGVVFGKRLTPVRIPGW